MKHVALLVILALFNTTVGFAQENNIRSFGELLEIMEASEVMYNVTLFSELPDYDPLTSADELFPTLADHVEYPWVEEGDDTGYSLMTYPMDSLALQFLFEGEPFYQEDDFEKARSYYEKALKANDQFYVSYLHLGDTYLFSGDPETAITYYQRAAVLNPYDYRCFYYLANAMVRAGRKDEALASYISALSLKPRHENLLSTISNNQDFLDVVVMDVSFTPEALVRKTGDQEVSLYLSESDNGIWMPYAFAKAVWLGEGGGRSDARTWSSQSELEAMVAVVDGYAGRLESGDIAPVPWLDRLSVLATNGWLSQYIIYEIGSRMNPDVTLTLNPDIRDSLREFIREHVVVSIET
ncbi:MAG: tetratricopeptide repeat protein [Candidatus Latescibacteria bacterium]|nr:tetratricopeptide repeat protein [Candidatus Latescibacterota bacterium]